MAQATRQVELMTYVTCPTFRYHPAVVAQKAATMSLLSEGRFTLGLGAGENLNEHVVGEGWPAVDARQDALVEAIEIIRALHTGELVTYDGQYFRVDSARVWDVPDDGVPIAVAVSGDKSVEHFAPLGDHLIQVEPDAEVLKAWNAKHDGPSRVIGQLPVSWAPDRGDRGADRPRAVPLVRRRMGRQRRPADAGRIRCGVEVRAPEDVAEAIACGPDLDALAESARPFVDAGFTDIAIVQIGDENQQRFLDEAAGPLLEKLRAL